MNRRNMNRRSMDRMGRARELVEEGRAERNRGNRARGRELYSQAAALYREADNPLRFAHTLPHVADMDREAGDLATAEPAYREALAVYRNHEHTAPLDLANTINMLALLLAQKGERDEAKLRTREALDLYAALNLDAGVAGCTRRLSRL